MGAMASFNFCDLLRQVYGLLWNCRCSDAIVKSMPLSALIEIGSDHLLADPEPFPKMLEACEQFRWVAFRTYYCYEAIERGSCKL